MSLENKLRVFQDNQRDSGWRIKWIAWQPLDKPEYVYNTPLTKVLGLLGAALFVSGCVGALRYRLPGLGFALAGLLMVVMTRLYAAWRQRHNWVEVAATGLDSEIRKGYMARRPGLQEVFELRLLCRFNYVGQEYTVTPEIIRLSNFKTEQAAQDFLRQQFRLGEFCKLVIDPDNPLHAQLVIHKK